MGHILKPGKKYTFSDYFELNYPTKEVLEEFGYAYCFEQLCLPQSARVIAPLAALREMYIRKLPHISLTSEAAKREFYVAPLLLELLNYLSFEINVEYPLDAGENLSGNIDYFMTSANNMVILEAKKGDMEKGFTQLAVELIALDKYLETPQPDLYGAVTLGDVWRFGILERATHRLKKDMNAYTLLSDLEQIVSILIGILQLATPPEKDSL